jgi:hypothetical protein
MAVFTLRLAGEPATRRGGWHRPIYANGPAKPRKKNIGECVWKPCSARPCCRIICRFRQAVAQRLVLSSPLFERMSVAAWQQRQANVSRLLGGSLPAELHAELALRHTQVAA